MGTPDGLNGNIFDARGTVDKHGSNDTKDWETISNHAYQDPINGVPVEVKTKNFSIKKWVRIF